MAKVAITESYLQDIADAIRAKTGLSSTYYPSQMSQAIMSISGSGGITPTGTINITSNGTHNVTQYASANVQVPTSASPNLQSKSVTIIPSLSTQEQTVNADSGYDGLSSVNITTNPVATGAVQNPVATKGTVSNHSISITPSVSYSTGYVTGNTKTGTAVSVSASQLVSGTLSVTSNGTKDVTNYASVNVNVSGGSSTPNLQDKTVSITPTTSSQSQTVTADSGYDGLDQVTINTAAVPTMTLPSSASSSASSGYTSKATIGRSTSNQYLNIPTGYNSTASYYTISATPNGSATAPSSISGTAAALSTGTNTLTLTKTVSVTPTVSAGYISAGTAGNSSVSLTANVTTKAAATITPGTTNQTIASGTYLTGTQTIAGDADLVAGNIKSGVSIFGVTGTYEGSGGGGDTGELTVATTTAQGTGTTYISFPVAGNPTSFVVIAQSQLAVDATTKAAAVSFDGTNCYADMITNTNNAQVTYSSYAYRQYDSGNVTIYLDTMTFPSTVTYKLIYTYNGTSSDVHTAETQVGSGATSISFTGLVGQPTYWSVVFKSNFSTSSGYQRVIAAANDGSTICGLAMDSSARPSTTYWSDSYNNGTLTISSQGTNAGGYFHQPGYYQLIYVTGAESETPSITVVPLNVTTNGTYTAPSGTAYSPVTVNVSGSSGMNVQGYHGMSYSRQTSLTATNVSLTVAKTGTYKVSWMGFRNTTSGTSSSQLYIGTTAYGNANSTFTSSYGQNVTLTGVSLTAGQTVTVYARARSTSYYMYVGNLIIEQTA